MRAYKVLTKGRSDFTGWRWPLPGRRPPRRVGPCGRSARPVHQRDPRVQHRTAAALAGRRDLGDRAGRRRAHRGGGTGRVEARLLRKIDAWDEPTRRRFAEACLERARTIADRYPPGEGLVTALERALSLASAAAAGYWTAVLTGESETGRRSGRDYDEAFLRERAIQAQWLRRSCS